MDLANLGLPDTLSIIPEKLALQFSPLQCTENLGKKYMSRGKLKSVDNLVELNNDILQGRVSSCYHNGNVTRRYVSANKRESNAKRYGVT